MVGNDIQKYWLKQFDAIWFRQTNHDGGRRTILKFGKPLTFHEYCQIKKLQYHSRWLTNNLLPDV